MPALCTLAPPSRRSVRCASSITCVAAGEDRPHRRAEALVQADRDRVHRRGELRHRDAERDRGVEEPRPVEMDVGAVALRRPGQLGRQLRRQDGAARPRVRVLEHEHQRARLDDRLLHLRRVEPSVLRPERPRLEAGDLLDPHLLRGEDVRGRLQDDGASARRDRQERDQVGHPARRHPERRLLAEQAGHPLLQLVDGRILAVRRPAELGRRASPPTSRPSAARAASERRSIDAGHRRSRWRPGRAPVCSAPSTTRTPLTRTCSTPRAYTVGFSRRRDVVELVPVEARRRRRCSPPAGGRDPRGRSARPACSSSSGSPPPGAACPARARGG